MLLLFMLGVALGAPPLEEFDADKCPSKGTQVWQFYTATAEASSPDLATEMATDKARRLAQRDLCPAGPTLECKVMQSLIRPQGHDEVSFRRGTYRSCASFGVKHEELGRVREQLQQAKDDMRTLAQEVQAKAGKRLSLARPTWSSGCDSSAFGAIRHALTSHLDGVAIVPPLARPPAPRVSLDLSKDQTSGRLTAYVSQPGKTDREVVRSVEFPLTLYGIDPQQSLDCISNEDLGLASVGRRGVDGLGVQVTMDAPALGLCDGQEFTVSIHSTRPARIRLFSVYKDGTALLAYPYQPGLPDVVRPQQPIEFPGMAAGLEGAGQETLVVVAVPPHQSLGPLAGADRFCRVPGRFSEALYPPGAGVHRLSFEVEPPYDCQCAEGGSQRVCRELRRMVVEELKADRTCW